MKTSKQFEILSGEMADRFLEDIANKTYNVIEIEDEAEGWINKSEEAELLLNPPFKEFVVKTVSGDLVGLPFYFRVHYESLSAMDALIEIALFGNYLEDDFVDSYSTLRYFQKDRVYWIGTI